MKKFFKLTKDLGVLAKNELVIKLNEEGLFKNLSGQEFRLNFDDVEAVETLTHPQRRLVCDAILDLSMYSTDLFANLVKLAYETK